MAQAYGCEAWTQISVGSDPFGWHSERTLTSKSSSSGKMPKAQPIRVKEQCCVGPLDECF